MRPEDVTVVSSTSGKQLPPEKAAEYTRKKYVYHGSYIGNSAIPLLSPYVLQAAGFVGMCCWVFQPALWPWRAHPLAATL